MEFWIFLALQAAFAACFLWLGTKMVGESASWGACFLAAFISSPCRLFRFGEVIGFIVLLVLLEKWTSLDIWPTGIFVVVLSWILSIMAGVFLGGLLLVAIA